jgi:hypothetical protein
MNEQHYDLARRRIEFAQQRRRRAYRLAIGIAVGLLLGFAAAAFRLFGH